MKNTISDHIIAFLLSCRSTKIYRKILWRRIQQRKKGVTAQAFNQSIYRLHKKGILAPDHKFVKIHKKRLSNISKFFLIKDLHSIKTTKVLLSFDIPQTKKKTRDWLRSQIKYWDFEMIHQSLWLGYGPLPEEFNERLKSLGISNNVRIFKVRKLT